MKFSSPSGKIYLAVFALVVAGGSAFVALEPKFSAPDSPTPLQRVPAVKEPKKPAKPRKQWIRAKGLHVTGWIAGGKKSFQKLVELCNRTELNTLCIDIKDSDGVVSYDTEVPLERKIEASRKCIADIDQVLQKMVDNDIYPIARIVVFKDPILATAELEMAVKKSDGSIWRDRSGIAWTNPYDRRVWEYNVDIAVECAKLGFKEIQWDYVRFPSDGDISLCVYPDKTDQTESEIIAGFLKYARERLEPYGVVISADIFGLTSLVKHDMGIGQTIKLMAEHVDYICPMVYPSHYALGEYGISNPNKAPYKTVLLTLRDAVKKVKGTKCKIRPWLQDFSLRGVSYGKNEVLAQRKAAKEVGLTEFLLWNPRCEYTEAALAEQGIGSRDQALRDKH